VECLKIRIEFEELSEEGSIEAEEEVTIAEEEVAQFKDHMKEIISILMKMNIKSLLKEIFKIFKISHSVIILFSNVKFKIQIN